ncbi:MAG TPA: hypothetical protein VK467_09850, partial [Gemmatimonadales bacterium]|nr:hypothetical protein [Gemmatimonadales bacterium]
SKQGAVEIAKVVVAQIADRLPQVGFRRRAEDFGCGALGLGAFRSEQHAPAPNPVLGATHREANINGLSVETYRRKVVDDLVERRRSLIPSRLCWHAVPFWLVCAKI